MEIKVKSNQAEEIEGLSSQYPYVMHHVDFSKAKIPWHWHEEVEFNYILNGKAKLTTASHSYFFHEKEAFFINANILHTLNNAADGQELYVDSHLFHPVFLGGHFRSIFEIKYLEPVLKNNKFEIIEFRDENKEQKEILERLRYISLLQKKDNTEFQTRNAFSDIWLLLIEELHRLEAIGSPIKLVNQDRIQSMLAFIQQNYDSKITLEEIAAAASVSKRECIRCFQTCLQKTPFEYLLEYRIQMAEKLLRTSNASITEIAMKTGFSNSAYFSKIFRKLRNTTPGEYRSQWLRFS